MTRMLYNENVWCNLIHTGFTLFMNILKNNIKDAMKNNASPFILELPEVIGLMSGSWVVDLVKELVEEETTVLLLVTVVVGATELLLGVTVLEDEELLLCSVVGRGGSVLVVLELPGLDEELAVDEESSFSEFVVDSGGSNPLTVSTIQSRK